MSMHKLFFSVQRFFLICAVCLPLSAIAQSASPKGIGQALADDVLAGWNIDISASGEGLPSGQGNAILGAQLYVEKCQACHGVNGTGGPANKLTGGSASLSTSAPLKSIGSFWPYATTLFDYIRRAMPLTSPQSLSAEQVYALSAYLLFINGIIEESHTLDARSLPLVRMPNRQGFKPVIDALPD
jgi:S-disulfanyl-L-cysteine oxidoreductase SoxD